VIQGAEELRANTMTFSLVSMSKTHWNTIALNESVSDALVKELIDHSYELICNSLPKIQT
jgi:predicted DNA-binding protein (MmcQ/YjbR family)